MRPPLPHALTGHKLMSGAAVSQGKQKGEDGWDTDESTETAAQCQARGNKQVSQPLHLGLVAQYALIQHFAQVVSLHICSTDLDGAALCLKTVCSGGTLERLPADSH